MQLINSTVLHIPQGLWRKRRAQLQTGIDVRGDVPDVILHGGVPVFQRDFDLPDGVQYGGVIPGKFLADVRQTQVGELADQIHGDLPGLGGTLVFLGTPQNDLVDGIELAHLADDQAGGGQGVALALEHIVNRPGDIRKIQRHVIQVPVGQNFLDRTLNLPDVVGDVDGNVVAHVIGKVQSQIFGLVFQNGHTGLIIRWLNVREQAPLKPGFQPILQGQHVAGLAVGGHDDLLMLLVELIEGMEEFLLGGFLTGDELHVVDEKKVGFPVFAAEFDIFAVLNGGNQFIGKLVAFDVDDVGVGIFLMRSVCGSIRKKAQ